MSFDDAAWPRGARTRRTEDASRSAREAPAHCSGRAGVDGSPIANATSERRLPRASSWTPLTVLALQRSAGNAAVGAMLARTPVSTDLSVGDVLVSFDWGVDWAPKGATSATVVSAPK